MNRIRMRQEYGKIYIKLVPKLYPIKEEIALADGLPSFPKTLTLSCTIYDLGAGKV